MKVLFVVCCTLLLFSIFADVAVKLSIVQQLSQLEEMVGKLKARAEKQQSYWNGKLDELEERVQRNEFDPVKRSVDEALREREDD